MNADERIRQLIAACRAMPRSPERSRLELQLGILLKRQDAAILKASGENA
jgi:hypothetical protein